MAQLMRNCIFGQARRCLLDIRVVSKQNYHSKCSPTLFKATVVSFQVKRYSTAPQAVSEDEKDNNKDQVELIYAGKLKKKLRNIRFISLTTSALAFAMQPVLYHQASSEDNLIALLGIFTVVGVFSIITPGFLHIIGKKYITDLYYDAKEDKYIGRFYNFFVQSQKVEFTPDDVKRPTIDGMFYNCLIKGQPRFLDPAEFEDITHYKRIMGYDKPLKFKLGRFGN